MPKADDENLTLASGAWCTVCEFFSVGADPSDPSDCGHGEPERVHANVVWPVVVETIELLPTEPEDEKTKAKETQ